MPGSNYDGSRMDGGGDRRDSRRAAPPAGSTGMLARVASAARMQQLGAAVGRVIESGDRLLLEGPFGAGKTTFVQGLARGLGVDEGVTSPSFVIENQYRGGRLPLYHVDLYRLERLDDALLDQLEEHLFGDGVCVVEWPEHLPEDLRMGATVVHFSVEDDQTRLVALEGDPRIVAAAGEATSE